LIEKEKLQLGVSDWSGPAGSPGHRPRARHKEVGTAVDVAVARPASRWIGEIRAAWAKAPARTLELARILCKVKEHLAHGGWKALWQSDSIPFSQSKGAMLLAIGRGSRWANVQTFVHLPIGWSILHELARLDCNALERFIQEGVIHPALSLAQARQLVERVRPDTPKNKLPGAILRERLRRLDEFVRENLPRFSSADRQLARAKLATLVAQIGVDSGIACREQRNLPVGATPLRRENSNPIELEEGPL